ncbi:hypothetical protein [Pseudobdellovibrio sp. HCB154]|uniref:hypothetical protein n=1 Tax=Pseudobdellovibrio sp. HCB154 TaxID=3386277 RepID=UPI0039172643
MNRFNKMNDDELKSFIKENQPQAPKADAGELNSLMRQLNLKQPESSSNTIWLWLSTGLAASLFMFHFLTVAPTITEPPAVTTATVTTAQPISIEEDDEYTEASVPTLDVGEEYLTLAGF